MSELSRKLVLAEAEIYGGMTDSHLLATRHGLDIEALNDLLDEMENDGLIETAYILSPVRTIVHVRMRNAWFDRRRQLRSANSAGS